MDAVSGAPLARGRAGDGPMKGKAIHQDPKAYAEGWDRIFGGVSCDSCHWYTRPAPCCECEAMEPGYCSKGHEAPQVGCSDHETWAEWRERRDACPRGDPITPEAMLKVIKDSVEPAMLEAFRQPSPLWNEEPVTWCNEEGTCEKGPGGTCNCRIRPTKATP